MTLVRTLLESQIGRSIATIRRVFYVHKGVVNRAEGPLELTCQDGSCLLLEPAGNAYDLRAEESPWIEIFGEPLSPENAEFVARSGKWTAFDVSSEDPYAQLIGHPIEQVEFVQDEDDTILGVILQCHSTWVLALSANDDLIVEFGDLPSLCARGSYLTA